MKSSLQKGHFFISSSLGFALSDGLVCSMVSMSSSAIRYDDNVMILLWHMLQEFLLLCYIYIVHIITFDVAVSLVWDFTVLLRVEG